ncbi:MAG: Spy/CpxP family protein refolding chaperone [Comamonas sp.]
MSLLQRSAIVSAMLTALSLPAFAQSNTTAATTPSADQIHAAPGKHHHRSDPKAREARMEKHMQALKTSLKLNASQETAWADYTAAIKPQRPPLAERPAHANRQAFAAMTTPERLDAMQAMHSKRQAAIQAHMEQRNQATKAFYAALSPEQQKTFDSETLKMHDAHGKGRPHGDKPYQGKHQGPSSQQSAPAFDSK